MEATLKRTLALSDKAWRRKCRKGGWAGHGGWSGRQPARRCGSCGRMRD
jgi:hypothetical protein